MWFSCAVQGCADFKCDYIVQKKTLSVFQGFSPLQILVNVLQAKSKNIANYRIEKAKKGPKIQQRPTMHHSPVVSSMAQL